MSAAEIAQLLQLLEDLLQSSESNATITLSDSTIDELSDAIIAKIEESEIVERDSLTNEPEGIIVAPGSISAIGSAAGLGVYSEFQNQGLVQVDGEGTAYLNSFSEYEPYIFVALLLYFFITMIHNIFNKFRGVS